jgi:hypothetical protein
VRGSIRQRGSTFTAYWFTLDPATGNRVQHTRVASAGRSRPDPRRATVPASFSTAS